MDPVTAPEVQAVEVLQRWAKWSWTLFFLGHGIH